MNKYINFLLVPIILFGISDNSCYSIDNDNVIHDSRLQYIRAVDSCENSFLDCNNTIIHFIDRVRETYHWLFLRIRWICEYLDYSESNQAKQMATNIYNDVRNFARNLQHNIDLRKDNINNIYNIIALEIYIIEMILDFYRNTIIEFTNSVSNNLGNYHLSHNHVASIQETINEIVNTELELVQLKDYMTQH